MVQRCFRDNQRKGQEAAGKTEGSRDAFDDQGGFEEYRKENQLLRQDESQIFQLDEQRGM
jgi:hypothetical protein